MSDNGGGGGGGRGNGGGGATASAASGGGLSIPPGSRKIVQNLKEIVNFPEQEIYAMLKECNMDPSETVNRLLNQDTFQEVKSKRDKKKEVKDTIEPKARGVSSIPNRGGRVGTDRTVRVGSSNSTSNDYGASRNKPLIKKENVPNAVPGSSILGSGVSGSAFNRAPSTPPANAPAQVVSSTDNISSSSKLLMGSQHAWSGVPGQVSMADIVRMGRPHSKSFVKSATATDTPTPNTAHIAVLGILGAKHSTATVLPSQLPQEPPSQDHVNNVSELIHEHGASTEEHVSHAGRSLPDKLPAENSATVFVASSSCTVFVDPSSSSALHDDGLNLSLDSRNDEIQPTDANVAGEYVATDFNISGGGLSLDDSSIKDPSSYQSQGHTVEHHEVEDANSEVSSIAANLQQIGLQKEGLDRRPAEDNPAVIFPNHLQVTNADCSHLSFGSFGSGISASFSGSLLSNTLKSNLEPACATPEPSDDHAEPRNLEYYNDEQSRSDSDENVAPVATTGAESYDEPSPSQPVVTGPHSTDPTHELPYPFPSSMPGYAFSSTTQPSAPAYSYTETSSQLQSLAPLSSMNFVQQAYTNSLPSNLLASTAQPGREFDLPYLQLLASQSIPTKYSTAISSTSEPIISMPENVKPSFFSMPPPNSQTLEGTSLQTGPNVPQHLPVHAYTQPTLPLGHFANMIGYPFLPPSYAYVPPPAAFPQAYSGNNAYHQTPVPVQTPGAKYTLPQYKTNVSISNLPQAGTGVPSGYGGFGSSANIPGSFMLNPPTTPASTTTGYEDTLGSQYKDGNHYASLQQNENSNMWLQGAGSRTVSALPASTYYGLQGQSQNAGFRQAQQQPSNYGSLGYPNLYRSQVVVPQEHQQNPSDVASLSSSQGLPSQSSHHMWQNNY